METRDLLRHDPLTRVLAERALSRAAGAPLTPGNSVRILRNASENYPAWLAAIRGAQRDVFFENYIIAADEIGREFAAALTERARAGVRVRVIYDWMGTLGLGSRQLWRPLLEAGGEVRCFNPPRFDSPFGWLTRDHRKMIAVDGEVGFVSGLCVSRRWVGDVRRRREQWRDTGIELRGPAVADIRQAFAQAWAAAGTPLPDAELMAEESIAVAGDVAVRVLATAPATAGPYRLDQLIAAMARRSLWLTDTYFVGVSTYVQALRAAALDGVDVRLLVPGASDIPSLTPITRAGYRPLLEAGVRVFEWNGAMLHAKTAVADERWARVGSTNLNLASWIGNYELDVAMEDEGCAREMQQMYLADLENATEIVLGNRRRVRTTVSPHPERRARGLRGGSTGRAAAGALRLGNAVSAAMTNRRVLGPAEASVMATAAAVLVALAVVALFVPKLIVIPLVVFGLWVAAALTVKAYKLRAGAEHERAERTPQPSPTDDS
ncbi:MAG TPA: phospholipase D-like domain-containing protein [Burkholderiales bacterium]|jgi:cardiolipin synthase|nr:phospholipase D-like domain-containing protein [Burkholderiales bacterium]